MTKGDSAPLWKRIALSVIPRSWRRSSPTSAKHVFISHSSQDDVTVTAIRDALLACRVAVWDDARQLIAGNQLEPEISRALEQARAVVAVLSARTINSKWVTKEIRYALDIQQQRGEAYKVIPVIVGIEPSGLAHSPRPEDERASYIDHRVSARPVVEALSSLGELAELTLLSPPTLATLTKELDEAQRRGKPYHVVHFDGHGVYSQQTGLGALCFERAEDSGKTDHRRSDIVDATKLAEVMRGQRVPLFFLEACQTALAERARRALREPSEWDDRRRLTATSPEPTRTMNRPMESSDPSPVVDRSRIVAHTSYPGKEPQRWRSSR